jgi:hypothetical protein
MAGQEDDETVNTEHVHSKKASLGADLRDSEEQTVLRGKRQCISVRESCESTPEQVVKYGQSESLRQPLQLRRALNFTIFVLSFRNVH